MRLTGFVGGCLGLGGIVALLGCGNVVVAGSGGSTSSTSSSAGGSTTSAQGGSGPGGGGTAQGGTGGATSTFECTEDADCADTPATPYCNTATGTCVECLPVVGPCNVGVCDPATLECVCELDADCLDPALPACDVQSKECVACVPGGSQCVGGTVCDPGSHTCVPECDPDTPCSVPGITCCFGLCLDLTNDVNHCGSCNFACPFIPQGEQACVDSVCQFTGCLPGYSDCDADLTNGCEHNVLAEGECTCQPFEQQTCYTGQPGTAGVGVCHSGLRTCSPGGTSWGPCAGQVLPVVEICANQLDDDCNGVVDQAADVDLDGWGPCDGDCNDLDPTINPGAMEITYVYIDDDNNPATPPKLVEGAGNGKDDDCNPATLDAAIPALCSDVAITSGVTPLDLAHAMDLCQSTAANPPKNQKGWGLISAEFRRPDGTVPDASELVDLQHWQTAVLSGYGPSLPKKGATIAGLSTGKMRALGDAGYIVPSPGTDFGRAGSIPATYLAAHNGNLPSSSGCSGVCPGGAGAYDGVGLRLVLRAPTNANFFSLDYRFFSGEYPGNVCTTKNDIFLLLDTSIVPGLPPDKNVVFDQLFNPLSVNDVFWDACNPSGCHTCPAGPASLSGTGMPAGTTLLTTDVPVAYGETITLDFMLFDVGDGTGDTSVVLDNFRFAYSAPCWKCGWD